MKPSGSSHKQQHEVKRLSQIFSKCVNLISRSCLFRVFFLMHGQSFIRRCIQNFVKHLIPSLSAANYFRKRLHLRCFTGFRIRLCYVVVSLYLQSFAVNMLFKNFGLALKRFDSFSIVCLFVTLLILLLMSLIYS